MRRRRRESSDAPTEEVEGGDPGQVRSGGPYDVADHPLEEDDPSRIDLGALSLAGHPDLEVRLQVDEASGAVVAALLVAEDGALELRPFAASRHHDMWEDVRGEIMADLERQGAGASEVDGPYGKALHLVMTGQTPDGQTVTQPTLLLGIDGPRWLLRVSAYGRPAAEWHSDGLLETALSQVVVVRGSDPMPPGDALPLQLPPEAQRQG
ncbi:DUF3710 domain-containing protein [Nocardioides marmoribigeumensis]|uniref:DUF3710 domain-containing protein n=1 Tax=Nocardioides marmoribigeumensis TaxID=433649 RepID=A0ABU2BSA8_9ACTN|nr:DUF3710 domain-containing protein [Nocardioides marmoribigeumensis]MDR7361151.1 hypothetical protein [Nocardioides marmoribigeumensis]